MLVGGYAAKDEDACPDGGAYPEYDEVGNAKDPFQTVFGGLTLAEEFWDGLLSEES
jgi:hypothetical protein